MGGERLPTWRCDSCDEQRYQCKFCISATHPRTPYHRVKWYNGHFYEDAWLRDAAVFIVLCRHNSGLSCPSAPVQPEVPDGFWETPPPRYAYEAPVPGRRRPTVDEDFDLSSAAHPADVPEADPYSEGLDEGEMEGQPIAEDDYLVPCHQVPTPSPSQRTELAANPDYDPRGLRVLTVCHDNGIHALGVQYCACPGAPSRLMQLIEKGIYPASRKSPSSGFTFRCLDRFLIDSVEGDTSAECFSRKLQRLTVPENPDFAPVRLLYSREANALTDGRRIDIRS